MGDLEIRSGGVVAVDTESLGAAVERLGRVGGDLDAVAGMLRRASAQIAGVPRAETVYAESRALYLGTKASGVAESARSLGRRLDDLAAVYETVELRSQRAAADAAGDTAAVSRLDARLDAIERAHPGSTLQAWGQGAARNAFWSHDLVGQSFMTGWGLAPLWMGGATALPLMMAGTTGALRAVGSGVIARDAHLHGAADPVRIRELPTPPGPAAAPTSLAAAAARIPSSDAGRVRVERYTMPDGTRQFAVYVRGTTSSGKTDAFDMESNLQLYQGERSASYAATLAALKDAGARPGDVVHAFGHSQGAMISSWLAVDGGYDTKTLVTFGSPVEADVGPGTLSVAVRHTDDPVAALQGGGLDAPVGAPGSFVAERSADPLPSMEDPRLGAHHLTSYEQTAGMLDASADPRMAEVRAVFAELGGAASVDVTEYGATRVSSSGADAG